MKRTKEEMRKTMFKSQEKVERLSNVKDEHKRRAAEEIEKRSSEIISKIEALQKEKEQVMIAPMTKEILFQTAKERFEAHRKRAIHEGLKDHFRACQEGAMIPFDSDRIRDSFPTHGRLLLQFFVITCQLKVILRIFETENVTCQ